MINESAVRLKKKYDVHGAAIAFIADREVKSITTYGFADAKKSKSIEKDTLFQVGSISKTLTAWAVIKLFDEGVINLDNPVELYLKRWHLPQHENKSMNITIKQLLSHTSGLPGVAYLGSTNSKNLALIEESLTNTFNRKKVLKRISIPGQVVKYSGVNYSILQLLIEEVTGRNYCEYMQSEILSPLGMKNSTFQRNNYVDEMLSSGFDIWGRCLPDINYTEKAAAGLYSSITDLTKLLINNLKYYNKDTDIANILKPESYKLMITRQNRSSPYGYGYIIRTLMKGNNIVFNTGTNRGWHSRFAFFTQKNTGIIILTNSDNGSNFAADIMKLWISHTIGDISEKSSELLALNNTNKYTNYFKIIHSILTSRNGILLT